MFRLLPNAALARIPLGFLLADDPSTIRALDRQLSLDQGFGASGVTDPSRV